jgi:hypothetical protein
VGCEGGFIPWDTAAVPADFDEFWKFIKWWRDLYRSIPPGPWKKYASIAFYGVLVVSVIAYLIANLEALDDVLEELEDIINEEKEMTEKEFNDLLEQLKNHPGQKGGNGSGGGGNKPPAPPIGVPDPENDDKEWPKQENGNCEDVAKEIYKRLNEKNQLNDTGAELEIKEITSKLRVLGPSKHNPDGDWWNHYVVVDKTNRRVYDGTTGPNGVSYEEYKSWFEYDDFINWGF